jgi:virginiamycin B lyase
MMTFRFRSSTDRAVPVLVLVLAGLALAGAGWARPANAATVSEFMIPSPGGPADEIAIGSDGALWLTETANGSIGRFAGGQFSIFPLPGGGVPLPESIVPGPDGALWFTDAADDLIWRISTDGQLQGFPIPPCGGCQYSGGSGTGNIVAGSDGALWYSRPGNDTIGRITTSGQVHEFPVGDIPGWITSGPDGAIWFTVSDGISRLSLNGKVSHVWSGLNYPSAIVTGPDGKLWFTGVYQDEVVSLTTGGTARLFTLQNNCAPEHISAGTRSLWVTCSNAHLIYRVSTRGRRTAFPVSSDFATLGGIVQAADGAVWFTDPANPLLGHLVTG